MSASKENRPPIGGRIVVALLILGGVAGVIGAVRLLAHDIGQQEFYQLVVPGCSLPIFAWTIWVGWGIWQGKAQLLWCAKILFTIQVLSFNVGGYAYEFYTGASASCAVEGWMIPMPPPSHAVTVGAHLGSRFHLNLTRQDSRWQAGINLLALIVLVYLFRTSRIDRAAALQIEEDQAPTGIVKDTGSNFIP